MNFNSNRIGRCMAALFLCLLLTGCGTKKNELLNYRVDIPEVGESPFEDNAAVTQNYLSDGICVIEETGQTKKQDSIMDAKASIMINDTDSKMLYSHNIYKKIYPASITKIVTALVVFKYGNLEDKVTVSYNASHITEYGAKLCGFEEGDKIILRDLLSSFLVHSGNDAGIAIAEHISGSEKAFAKLMNREMKNLGAVHSHFVNSHAAGKKVCERYLSGSVLQGNGGNGASGGFVLAVEICQGGFCENECCLQGRGKGKRQSVFSYFECRRPAAGKL